MKRTCGSQLSPSCSCWTRGHPCPSSRQEDTRSVPADAAGPSSCALRGARRCQNCCHFTVTLRRGRAQHRRASTEQGSWTQVCVPHCSGVPKAQNPGEGHTRMCGHRSHRAPGGDPPPGCAPPHLGVTKQAERSITARRRGILSPLAPKPKAIRAPQGATQPDLRDLRTQVKAAKQKFTLPPSLEAGRSEEAARPALLHQHFKNVP